MSISTFSVLEQEMDGNQLIVVCSISQNKKSIVPTHALIDTGASGYAFIDEDFVRRHELKMKNLRTEREIDVIDGRPIESGKVTKKVTLELEINGHVYHGIEHGPAVLREEGLVRDSPMFCGFR